MFFPEDQPEIKRSDPEKIIYVYENGVAENKPKQFKVSSKKNCFKEIAKEYNFHHLRLFNTEGAQYFQDDLCFVKNKTTLYASNGEEFDPAGCFGQYEIIKKLGQGGFGEVLLAMHKQTGEEVAIKIIRTNKIGSAADIDNIFVEAQTLKSLKHDNIVKVHNCLTLKNMKVAIIMQYLQGGQLLQLVKKQKKLDQQSTKNFIKQIAKAMSYCHANGLIHRDLKLQNMLLVNKEEHRIKIIDFGIAGIVKSLTWQDLDIGSLSYMAPQCFINSKDYKIDGRIDVWATGVIMYSMLYGELPFQGQNSTDIIQQIKTGEYRKNKKVNKQLSAECLDILEKMLIKNPKQRITMQDILAHPWFGGGFFQVKQQNNEEQNEKQLVKEENPKTKKQNKKESKRLHTKRK